MRMPMRAQAIGMGITFWIALAVLYPTVVVLETGERLLKIVREKTRK